MDLRLIVDGLGDIKHTDKIKYAPGLSQTKYTGKPLNSSETLSPIAPPASAPVSGCVSPPASPPGIHMLNITQNEPAYAIPTLTQSATDKMVTFPTEGCSGYLPERYSHPKHSNPPLVVPSARKKAATRAAKHPSMVPVQIKSESQQRGQREKPNSFPAFIPITSSSPNISPTYSHGTERYPSPPQINPSMPYMPLCHLAYPVKQGYVQVVPSGCVISSLPISSPQSSVGSPTTLSTPAPNSTSTACDGTHFHSQPPVYHPPPPINQNTASPIVKKESPQYSHARPLPSPSRDGQCNSQLLDYDNTNNSSRYWRFIDESSRDSGKPTVTANSLKQHILVLDADTNAVVTDKTNTTAKKFKYGCQQCGRAFFRKSDLVRHIQIHLGIKPNACGVCGKQFIQRSALTVHLRVHTGEKPFGCPRCGRAFSDSSSLARHRRIHERNANAVVERIKSSQSQVSLDGAK